MQYPVFPRFDNTATIKKLAQTVDLHIPKGKDKFLYEVGQVCQSSEIGVYKKGTQFTIKDRWMDHGYAYYKDQNGRCHRNKDIL